MCCSFWEKCKNSPKTSLGCSTPLMLFRVIYFFEVSGAIVCFNGSEADLRGSPTNNMFPPPYFCRNRASDCRGTQALLFFFLKSVCTNQICNSTTFSFSLISGFIALLCIKKTLTLIVVYTLACLGHSLALLNSDTRQECLPARHQPKILNGSVSPSGVITETCTVN